MMYDMPITQAGKVEVDCSFYLLCSHLRHLKDGKKKRLKFARKKGHVVKVSKRMRDASSDVCFPAHM